MRRLAVDDVAQAERLRAENNADQREAKREFVADHLRGSAEAAEQGELVVRRPARERDAVDADRRDAEDDKQADVEVGDIEHLDADPVHRDRCIPPKGTTAMEIKRAGQRDDRRDDKQRALGGDRHEVFLEEELDAVGQRLQQAERADARGSPAILDAAQDLALEQHRVGDRRQRDDQDDHDLEDAEQQKCLKLGEVDHFRLSALCFEL